jgi:hypothetical protein
MHQVININLLMGRFNSAFISVFIAIVHFCLMTQLIPCLKQVLTYLNDIFDTLLKALSDPSDEVI